MILLVEDSADDLIFMQRAFHKAGWQAPMVVKEDGEEAIHYLTQLNNSGDLTQYPLPSLIFLDLKLPRRNGLEVLEWLRTQSRLKRIPVIMLTSSRDSSDINQAYELGANAYMVKPSSLDQLIVAIATMQQYWTEFVELPSFNS
ncbi:MAG: response regulator [Anaerolineae bacterium]|nr:response regulator [Anaerolineae bacterium]